MDDNDPRILGKLGRRRRGVAKKLKKVDLSVDPPSESSVDQTEHPSETTQVLDGTRLDE